MGAEQVDWLTAAAMLACGVIVGVMLVWHVMKSAARPQPSSELPPEIRDLLAKNESLIRQLRELDDTAGKRNPEQLESERAALELEAARVLRDLDRMGASARISAGTPAEPATAAEPLQSTLRGVRRGAAVPHAISTTGDRPLSTVNRPPSAIKGFLWGTGSTIALLLLILLVYQYATARKPDEPLTGNLPPSGPAAQSPLTSQPPDPRVAELEARIARNPEDLEARVDLAGVQIQLQQLGAVAAQTDYVLARDPKHPRALAYSAVVKLDRGQTDEALTMLRAATAADPDLLEASVYLAIVYTQLGRSREAAATIQAAAKRQPEHAERLTSLLAEMRARAAMAAGGASESPAAGSIEGTIDVDPAARGRVGNGATIFVIVRPAGTTGGPPLAAKRLPGGPFPMSFSVSAADSMMGQPIPERIRLEVRLDSDGNPMTKASGDLSATEDPVVLGSRALRLLLR